MAVNVNAGVGGNSYSSHCEKLSVCPYQMKVESQSSVRQESMIGGYECECEGVGGNSYSPPGAESCNNEHHNVVKRVKA